MSEETRKRAEEYVRQRLSYCYPYVGETDRKVKYSVSELKHRAMDALIAKEEEEIETLSVEERKEEKESRFHPSEGALRGSATHRAMECFDIARLADKVIILNKGKVAAEGKPADVFKMQEIIQQAGLEVPQITQIMVKLQQAGLSVNSDIYIMDKAVEAIAQAVRGRSRC